MTRHKLRRTRRTRYGAWTVRPWDGGGIDARAARLRDRDHGVRFDVVAVLAALVLVSAGLANLAAVGLRPQGLDASKCKSHGQVSRADPSAAQGAWRAFG